MKTALLDQPPSGWFALDVVLAGDYSNSDWCALMIDVHPDELKYCRCKTAWLYVHPKDYRPDGRVAQEAWVRVPGKHRSRKAAWKALQEILATRH